ncbi:hypothetical protein GE061_018281 [Apolygus lucorum]|uniref:CCHC-type domain-containing protein n=1 Tax=Apolygus lucorum TaxID=248454 RepID=A0A8S9XDK9_APOLU|nr:hypothetical protein GE061_018281 [Apolygus lucorum]
MSTRNRPVTETQPVSNEPIPGTSHSDSLLEERVTSLEVLLAGISSQLNKLIDDTRSDHSNQQPEPRNIGESDTQVLHVDKHFPATQELLAYEGSLMSYDGKMPWEEYLVHVEVTSEANGWSEERSGKRLASALKGGALTVLSELPRAERTNYQAILKALSSRFGLRHQATRMRMLLEKRKQVAGEGLAELASDIERMVRAAYPDDPKAYRDTKGVQSFLDALRDTDLKRMLALTTPATVQEALRRAELADALGHNQQVRNELKCWGCNLNGHTKATCPKTSQNRVNTLDHQEN